SVSNGPDSHFLVSRRLGGRQKGAPKRAKKPEKARRSVHRYNLVQPNAANPGDVGSAWPAAWSARGGSDEASWPYRRDEHRNRQALAVWVQGVQPGNLRGDSAQYPQDLARVE